MNSYIHIQNNVRNIFSLPEKALILVSETREHTEKDRHSTTDITITLDKRVSGPYKILKPAKEIEAKDIESLHASLMETMTRVHPLRMKLFRLFGWWAIFAGALTAFSVCPVCGAVGCPVGIGTTGIIAGFFALIKQNGGNMAQYLKNKLFKKT